MNVTLNAIRAHGPCSDGWANLLASLDKTKADDEPLSLLSVLESNGLEDALWCLRAVQGHDRELRLFAVECARDVQHLMTDPRSIAALDVAERHANGLATDNELDAAQAAAITAAVKAGEAWEARVAAWVAVWAARAVAIVAAGAEIKAKQRALFIAMCEKVEALA